MVNILKLLNEYRVYNDTALGDYLKQYITNPYMYKLFYKEISNNTKYMSKITTQLTNEWDIKDKEQDTLRKFKPNDDLTNQLTHIRDWLTASNPNPATFNNIKNIDMAYQTAETWFNKQKVTNTQDGVAGTKLIHTYSDGYKILQLLTPTALDYESEHMGHCVGKGTYDTKVTSGKTIIYSLRDTKNEPHATMEVTDNILEQIKGKQNQPVVEKYREYISTFINLNNFKKVKDIRNIGLVSLDNKIYTLKQLYEMKDIVVKGDVDLYDMGLTKLPHFKSIGGIFDCGNNQLTSLEGCPTKVGGDLWCNDNQLTNLTGCPTSISGSLGCYNNHLTSLKGCPTYIGGSLGCYNNHLTSLKYCATYIGGNFYCNNNQLTSLDGCATYIGGDLDCSYNQLTSLEGCATYIGSDLHCHNNKVKLSRPKGVKIRRKFHS